MIVPLVASRMEEFGDFACLRIDPSQVRAFVQVAVNTGERQVIEVVAAPMYLRNYVFDVQDSKR